jgi:hypothetical protein
MQKQRISRRDFVRIGGGAGAGLFFIGRAGGRLFELPLADSVTRGGMLDAVGVPKFVTPMLIPPVMPRFRMLNGCQSRFLILDFTSIPGIEVWAIGSDGEFLAAPRISPSTSAIRS